MEKTFVRTVEETANQNSKFTTYNVRVRGRCPTCGGDANFFVGLVPWEKDLQDEAESGPSMVEAFPCETCERE